MPYYKHIHRVVEGFLAGNECYQAEGCDGRLYLKERWADRLEVTIRPVESKRERLGKKLVHRLKALGVGCRATRGIIVGNILDVIESDSEE